MPAGLRRRAATLAPIASSLFLAGLAAAADAPLPKVADGWSIARVAEAPAIRYPTAVVAAPDGSAFVGQDPMDMPGPVNEPVDSVARVRPDGSTRVFADKLHAVMGLEWSDGALYVVHAPFLSRFRDKDGDGAADERVDLVTGFGPAVPASNGLNDHLPSGVRLGMDGFLYVAVGDKGLAAARGADGKVASMSTGGVVRVRPDGTDLEVVSTGERNPLSVALTARDEVFTFGNDDDGHLWPNSLTHHVVGGHYGYPFEFLAAPHRALPIVAGQSGGAGAQGVCSDDAALPARFRGNLFFCDWGLQAVARYEVAPQGGTFRLVRREVVVEKGDLGDFRPFGIAPTADGAGFWLTDWAQHGWLDAGPPSGRLFRLTYTGADRPASIPRGPGGDVAAQLAGLDDPTRVVRLDNQRRLAASPAAAQSLAGRLADPAAPEAGRVHALWALDAAGSPEARRAIRAALADKSPAVRAQAARSAGIRRDGVAEPTMAALLGDPDPVARREAAIALGRIGAINPATRASLYAALKEPDPTAAWSVRRAIRDQKAYDPAQLAAALADPARRDSALTLADGSYAPEVVRVLVDALAATSKANADPAWRARVAAALGGLYAKVPDRGGRWLGPNPAAGPRPKATEAWDAPSMDAIAAAMAIAARDPDARVRRQAIIAGLTIGPKAIPMLRAMLDPPGEADPVNLAALSRTLGERHDAPSAPGLARAALDAKLPEEARAAALDALGQLAGPVAINARMSVLYDAASPDGLIARALPALGRARLLPANDVLGFLDHKSAAVRAAALGAFPVDKPLPRGTDEAMLLHADDPAPEVRRALAAAAGAHKVAAAVPWLVRQAEAGGADPALRAEAIRALAAMPDARAVGPLAAALNDRDPDLRRAAVDGLAAVRAAALPELSARAARGEFVGPGALAVERLLATFRPLLDWQVIGPFPRATGPLFGDARAIDFGRPEVGADGRSLAWHAAHADPKSGWLKIEDDPKPGPAPAPIDGATAFAVATVTSAGDRPALLLVDAGGPTIVAVDDRPLANLAGTAVGEAIRVDLKSGPNRILLRSRRGVGPWALRVELSEPAAAPAAGVAARPPSAQREGLRAFALRRAGDPKNGAALFRVAGGVNCARCHAAEGQPAAVAGLGPALDGLALKYDKAEVIRSVLEPSSRLAVGYAPAVVERTDGTLAAGLVRAESPAGIELLDPDGHATTVPADQIRARRVGETSPMPDGLVDGLKPVEFADLIAYLMSLKAPAGPTPGAR